jgi:hypothetical protein
MSVNYKYKILSIDVGITNLGLSVTQWDETWEKFNVIQIDLIDLSEITHTKVSKKDCKLHHTRHLVDKMDHFFQEYAEIFDTADRIIVELQPILGLKAVESLIYTKYRDKTKLIHPTKMHVHFRIQHQPYETRKELTVKLSESYILDKELVTKFSKYERQHDIADSLCIMKYWAHTKHLAHLERERKLVAEGNFTKNKLMSMGDFFDMYRYKGNL